MKREGSTHVREVTISLTRSSRASVSLCGSPPHFAATRATCSEPNVRTFNSRLNAAGELWR